MKCPQCQHFNRLEARACAACAAPLVTNCAHCGLQLSSAAKFCPECAEPTGVPAGTSPEAYTPRHLARKILASRAALEGERKQLTVLFADLKDSMEMLAERDPEDARKLLDPVLEIMMEAVHHYEGTVSQVMGDGIMALFGAPLAHEDHAVRACYAALRMQERVKRHAEGVLRTHGVTLRIRIGLNSGEVVVRGIGSDLHMDYTAIGRTVHLAARMEQLAQPGSILLTPSTLELAEGFVAAEPLGAMPVKGLAEALNIHELTEAGTARTRLQAGARRGLTQFVGRDGELEQLRRAQLLADAGHGQVVAIVAEAGVGKSRLVHELAHSRRLQGWLVLECAAVSYGKAMSYLPVVNLLKDYFEVRDQDSLQGIADKIKDKLPGLDHALEPIMPALLALLDVPATDAAWQTLDPAQRRQRMLDAVRHLLLREARRQPLLLIFEDLHWIDSETQAFLDGLVESLGSARVLLLATYRPDYQHGWGGKTYYGQIRLNALPPENAGKMLDALLGDDPTLAPLKQLLVKRGNPFFLEETVRTLVETKALEGLPGRYRLTRPVDSVEVPATVQVMLAARIDRLPAEEKHLLQVASVIGRHVPFALLRAVTELPDEALRGGLDDLQAAEFVYETGLYPDLEYSFKHALTRDATYGGLLQERRRELHAQIVGAIETLHGDRLGEHIERLAHHALRGELREKAVSYLLDAGRKAGRQAAPLSAQGWFEQALDVIDTLPESRFKIGQAVDIRVELRGILSQLDEAKQALQRLREAEALAETLDDDERRVRVSASLAGLNCLFGELDEALAAGTRALTLAERLEDLRLRVFSSNVLAQVHYYRGEYGRAVELANAVVAAVPADQPYMHYFFTVPIPIHVRYWQVMSLAELGRFAEATPHTIEARRLAEPTHHAYSVGIAHLMAGWLHIYQGDWAQARPLIEKGVAMYRAGNIGLALPHVIASSARILAQIGEVKEALNRLWEGEELLERRAERGVFDRHGMNYQWLGRAALLLGRLGDARRLAGRSLECSPSHPGFAAHAQNLLGDLAAHPDRFDAECSETHYRKALALAEPRGMRPLIAHCHLGLGKLHQRTSKRERAREHLATAQTMYREMDMGFWLEQAEVASRQST